MSTDLVNRGAIALNVPDGNSEWALESDSTIIVTGVARGGTSMVAQVLEQLGVFMGDAHDPVVVEDRDILSALQRSDKNGLKSIIADRNQKFRRWGFKVPNLHNFLRAHEETLFRNPRFIAVFRDPLAIARRNELSMRQDIVNAIREAGHDVMKLTSYVSALTRPGLMISYEKSLQYPDYMVDSISTFCGLSPTKQEKAAALGKITSNGAAYIFATQVIYRGHIDKVIGDILSGWCCFRDKRDVVDIEVFANEEKLCTIPSNQYREDLEKSGVHLGYHAFSIDLAPYKIDASAKISVRPAGYLIALPNSDKTLQELRTRK